MRAQQYLKIPLGKQAFAFKLAIVNGTFIGNNVLKEMAQYYQMYTPTEIRTPAQLQLVIHRFHV